MTEGASTINALEPSTFQFHHYMGMGGGGGGGGGGCTGGTVRPLLSHHFRSLRRRPRHRTTSHAGQDGSDTDEENEDLDNGRHQISFRYTTSIITTTNRNGHRYHRRVEDQGNNADFDDNDDGDDDTETWTPFIPFVVVLPRRVEHSIVRVLRQLPDVMFLFWCLYVFFFLLLVHNHHHHHNHCQSQSGRVDYCHNYHKSTPSPQTMLHEFQLRKELGLTPSITPPPPLPMASGLDG